MTGYRQCGPFLLIASSILLFEFASCCLAQAGAADTASQTGTPPAAAPASAPDKTPVNSANWRYNPAPGAQLELREAQRTSSSKGTTITYKFAASGFPTGKIYTIWIMRSGDHKTFPLMTGYSADAGGKLVCADESQSGAPAKSRCLPFENISLDIDHYHKGEPVDFALISTDGTVRAYARAFPFPIQAEDGKCALTVAMENSKFTLFVITATGFEAGEQVTVSSTFENAGAPHAEQASSQGKFADIIEAKGPEKDSGPATFTAAGRSCQITVTYDWGKAAMKVQ